MKKIKKATDFFSSPILLHYTLPFVIIYLIAGTIAQKYIGLYDATKIFFADIIIWLGPAPIPGFPIFITIIFINLACKLFFKSPWTLKNSGNVITHIGAMLLLLGGLFTALFSNEGYIDIMEGQKKSFVADYHKRELTIYDKDAVLVKSLPLKDLKIGKSFTIANADLTLEILEACRNCQITKRQNADETFKSMAQHMQISEGKAKKTDEENMAGITVRINDEVHTILEDIPNIPEIETNNNTYRISLGKEKRELPFSIELIEFKKDSYQGIDMAKAYSSRVRIHDGETKWESVISMNAPLRYKGYTLFQSSFAKTPSGEISVLAVVWNVGRAFPYISGILMCFGMLLHLFMRTRST